MSDVLWKQEHGFLAENQVESEAIKQLDKLMYHKAWWVRLYVAEILRQHPEFQTPAMVQRLKDDSHPLVRETALQIGKPTQPRRAERPAF